MRIVDMHGTSVGEWTSDAYRREFADTLRFGLDAIMVRIDTIQRIQRLRAAGRGREALDRVLALPSATRSRRDFLLEWIACARDAGTQTERIDALDALAGAQHGEVFTAIHSLMLATLTERWDTSRRAIAVFEQEYGVNAYFDVLRAHVEFLAHDSAAALRFAEAAVARVPALLDAHFVLARVYASLQRHADVRRSTPAVYGAAPSREAVIDQSPLTKRVAEAIHAECSRRFRFIYEVSYANAAAMFHPKHAALEHLSVLPPAERNQVQHGLYALVVNEVASNAQQRSMSLTAQDVQLVEASLIRLHQYAKDATDKNETPLRFWGDLKQARRPVNPTVASAFALGSCVIEGFFAYAPSTAYMERVFKTARQVDLTRFNLSDVNFEFNVLLQAYMRQLFPATSKDSATKIVAFAKKLIDLTH